MTSMSQAVFAPVEARELAWQGGDSSASVCQAEQQCQEEPSLTSLWRNVNLGRQSERDWQEEKKIVLLTWRLLENP